jgi:hypothetical protein
LRTLLIVAAVGLILSTAPAASQTGIATGNYTKLYAVDPPFKSVIGDLGFRVGPIAFSPQGELFAVETEPQPRLYVVDPADGSSSLVGDLQLPMGDPLSIPDLAFLGDGRLFVVAKPTLYQATLYSVDPTTGQTTLVGETSSNIVALSGTGLRLVALSIIGHKLVLQDVDIATGELNPVGPGFEPDFQPIYGSFAMDFDDKGQLWLMRSLETCFGCGPRVEFYKVDLEGTAEFWGWSEYPLFKGWAMAPPRPGCARDSTELCLHDRFRVSATSNTPNGQEGSAHPVSLGENSGGFWFFEPGNLELLVKVINACAPPWNHYWVFASGLTNVEVTLSVEDVESGETWKFENPQGQKFPPIQDTLAFETCP